ncbi:MAG: alpha-glucan family phosphorylase [Gammaproteobacteria bacterium]|nr:alpha-glucan family phosphorylase [Gammaproteobacteria bacterium]
MTSEENLQATCYALEVQPRLPSKLARLAELADDLLYSWDRQVRGLFFRLDTALWDNCGHNPKVFLRRIAQQKLDDAVSDRVFMEEYYRVLSGFDTYHQETMRPEIKEYLDPSEDLVAYFCAEFGFHESVQLYSGGLGILAGDHCKAASDLNLPFVAVGLLYRQGYFKQTIDNCGSQIASYLPTHFEDLPIDPVNDAQGGNLEVSVQLPGREVFLRVWRIKAGHISLYLLDSDLPKNSDEDRRITYQLYGGDIHTRIRQWIVLGIGGVRLLRALGIKPTVWHINEGHAAFLVLERMREHVAAGLDFDSALEAAAANTVFTTHTPVPAGHDIFDHDMMSTYFGQFASDLRSDLGRLMALGASPANPSGFNQTALALRGSRFRNGVSRIHGNVASKMSAFVWPQIPADENPLGYVTNGVHVPTFLAREWANLFDMRFGGGWRNELVNPAYWEQQIDTLPDHSFWSLRQSLKSEMLADVRRRLLIQFRRNGCSELLIDRLTQHLTPSETETLTIGFARRFATYKRAYLLFSDPERLARLLKDPKRPCLIIFAGKAHPNDKPAQELIKKIHDYSRSKEFEGHVILLEGYDMALARKLVTGVDVWLNTPESPLEASGTSGEKAAINGVVNLSVLDGWWGEGYDGHNGWAITPHGPNVEHADNDREEGAELLDLLENNVIPLYYDRNGYGYSAGWVKKSKASLKTILPRFNAQRMVMDYVRNYYSEARQLNRVMTGNDYARAREVAAWRRKLATYWPKVRLHRVDNASAATCSGEPYTVQVAVTLSGLQPDEVLVECLFGQLSETGKFIKQETKVCVPGATSDNGDTLYTLDLIPDKPGLQHYYIRVIPFHTALGHRYEAGYMLWL